MNTKAIGDITEARVMAALLRAEKAVLIPFGDNQRYDLVVDDDGKFIRVQCKTGRLKKGSIHVDACSIVFHGRNSKKKTSKRGYHGEADVFGVYCPELDKVYLVPVDGVGARKFNLRVEPTNQRKKIVWAKDYEIQNGAVA